MQLEGSSHDIEGSTLRIGERRIDPGPGHSVRSSTVRSTSALSGRFTVPTGRKTPPLKTARIRAGIVIVEFLHREAATQSAEAATSKCRGFSMTAEKSPASMPRFVASGNRRCGASDANRDVVGRRSRPADQVVRRVAPNAQCWSYTVKSKDKTKTRNQGLLDSAGSGCAGAQCWLSTAISLGFERRLVA